MANSIQEELGLGPVVHRLRRWVSKSAGAQDQRTLDPLTVNYAAWDAVRKTTRAWPSYREAPNSLEVYVSPEDWEEFWGIDTGRKEEAVAAYVQARVAERGYWLAGKVQVVVLADDGVDVGECEVECQFVEPVGKGGVPSLSGTAPHEPLPADGREVSPTLRYADPETAGLAWLVGEGGFRLAVRSGDCIGTVGDDGRVSPDVNIRLDAKGFPYVAPKQCTLGVLDGRWVVENHALRGTMLVTAAGMRLMLGEPDPYPIGQGDVLYLGPLRPLRFEVE